MGFHTTACAPPSDALAYHVADAIQQSENRKKSRTADALASFNLAVDLILGDLFIAYLQDDSHWAYRSERPLAFSGEAVGYKTWKIVIPALIELGYVDYHKGSSRKNPFEEGTYLKGLASRFKVTESLVALAESHGIRFDELSDYYITAIPKNVLRLKASNRGKLEGAELPIDDTPKTRALSVQVHRLNKYLSQQTLNGGSFEGYRRSFSNGELPRFNWNQGGRLYAVGNNSYQQLRSERRGSMHINGEPVIEIDVSASHLSIYMGEMGQRAPDGIDLYAINGFSRAAVKQYIASSFGLAKLINKWPTAADAEVVAFDVVNVKEAVCGAIPCLVSLADSGLSWATLQFLEAEALIEAMESLHEQDIPAYGVHDSLIVPVTGRDAAHNALKKAWQIRGWSIRLK